MTIPTSSNYPDSFDDHGNLYLVHDALRVRLASDYTPGDTEIIVDGDISGFPDSGQLTLTDQCSDYKDRAISFYYASKTADSFLGLEILPGFTASEKPKRLTNVTMQVMADMHNNIAEAIIAIEEFIGVNGTIDTEPNGETLQGRVNFLTKLIMQPRAWFTADTTIGLIPLEVTFTDESTRLGNCEIIYTWDFGDVPSDVSSTVSYTSNVPSTISGVLVRDMDGRTIKKTYTKPGIYKVGLKVQNEFGEDTVVFQNMINARLAAPDTAVIDFVPRSGQIVTNGSPTGGPYTTFPTIKAEAGTLVSMEIPAGINPNTDRTYSGEQVDDLGSPIDPIVTYTWELGDDLDHTNSNTTDASYSVGDLYDLVLRVDTSFGSYRITTYENVIDIVESQNLWLWYENSLNDINSYEFGFISETFKTRTTPLTVVRDDSFLDGTNNEVQAKKEFNRNVGFAQRTSTGSGSGGTAHLHYATGGAVIADQEVAFVEYNGFAETYTTHPSFTHPWNWMYLNSEQESFFVFGQEPPPVTAGTNPSFQIKTKLNLTTQVTTDENLVSGSYSNGASELQEHVSVYDSGVPTNGYFAVYRGAWRNGAGYFLRNSGVGQFYRIRSFYQTVGTLANPFQSITKLDDMAGSTKLEGQLVNLTDGLFFFNNSSDMSIYDSEAGVWKLNSPALSSTSFNSLQDINVSGYNSGANSLLAASDNDRVAYLSFDYSENAFIKYSGTDNTFIGAGTRPAGNQFLIGVF